MSALRSYAAVSFLAAAVLPLGGTVEAGREPVRYDRPLSAYDRQVVERVPSGPHGSGRKMTIELHPLVAGGTQIGILALAGNKQGRGSGR